MLFWILLVLVVCLLFYQTIEDIYLFYVQKIPPGPISLPLIGGLYKLDPRKPHIKLQNLVKKYGDIMSFRLGMSSERMVVLHNTKHVETICNNMEASDRPYIPYFALITPDGAGIGSRPYDKIWMFHTRIIRQAISKISKNCLNDKMTEVLTILFQRLNSRGDTPQAVEPDLSLASLHIMLSVCYGVSFDDWTNYNMKQILKEHCITMDGLNPLHPINIFPWIQHFSVGFVNKIKQITKSRDELHQQIFKEHTQTYTGEVHDIMDIIVEVMKNRHDNYEYSEKTEPELKNLFMSFTCLFMAGIDNIKFIMLWGILVLSKNPNIAEKIYEEIDKTTSLENTVTMEMKKHLPFTEACVYEIIRISSPAPLGIPRINRNDIDLDGYKIPKGSQIFTNIWHLHNSNHLWTDPKKVQPERFLDEDGYIRPKHDEIYKDFQPFGRGKRTCTGAAMVMDVTFLFISNLVRTQTMELLTDIQELVGDADLNHKPPAFEVIFKPRLHTNKINSAI